jgi:hypothetical protein
MNRCFVFVLGTLLFAAYFRTAAIADPQPIVKPSFVTAVNCIRQIFQSNGSVETVDLYRVPNREFAIEFRFVDTDNQLVVGDIMLSDRPSWGTEITYTTLHFFTQEEVLRGDQGKVVDRESAFVDSLDLARNCGTSGPGGFDDTLPGPAPRSQWQKVDWPNPG